jgi:GH25 family lysozyme M1 (1,4-beta-N-acetylmuramidase)
VIKVIDVSNNNGMVLWPAVAASGVEAAVMKASEGVTYRDAYFADNWRLARSVGLVRGAYHYALPSLHLGHEEAAFFLQVVGDSGGIQVVDDAVLDLEDPDVAAGVDLLPWLLDFLGSCERVLGFDALIYSSLAYLTEHKLVDRPELAGRRLWLADWGASSPVVVGGWSPPVLWQYGGGAVPGIGGVVDLDWFMGTAAELPGFGRVGPVPVPGPAPVPAPAPAPAPADADFREYAPLSGSWREAATNLKGVADDALARGRAVVKVAGDAAAAASGVWGGR